MIAAAPDMSSRLGLLSVVLRSLQTGLANDISPPLKAHTLDVLKAAAAINANPGAIVATTLPEAIELALKIQDAPALLQRLGQLSSFEAIQPDVADEILESIRSVAA